MSDQQPPRWLLALGILGVLVAVGAIFYAQQSKQEDQQRIKALEDEVANLKASKMTSEIPAEQKVPLLESLKPLLKVENEEVRARAVELTAYVAPKESDLLLDQVLRSDPSIKVKLSALNVIAKQKIAYSRSEVLKLLGSDDPALRRKAAWCLGELGKDADEEAMKKTREALVEALRKENDQWAATLAPKPSDQKPNKKGPEAPLSVPPGQVFALLGPYIHALGEIGDAESASKILFLLKNLDPLVRRETALALGKIGSPVPLPEILLSEWR